MAGNARNLFFRILSEKGKGSVVDSGFLSGLVQPFGLSHKALRAHDVPAGVQIDIGDSLIFIASGISSVLRNSPDFS